MNEKNFVEKPNRTTFDELPPKATPASDGRTSKLNNVLEDVLGVWDVLAGRLGNRNPPYVPPPPQTKTESFTVPTPILYAGGAIALAGVGALAATALRGR